MNKFTLFFAFLLIGTVALHAQAGFRFGIKAGANADKISGQAFKEGYNLSYHVGGFAEIDLTKKIGIQPELLWSQSTTTKASGLPLVYQSLPNDIKLDYLQIPILLRYNVNNMFTLLAGPQFSVLVNHKNNLLQNGETAFKQGDFAMVLGGQFNLKMLRVYGRYNIGLQNINDYADKNKWTNQQIQLGVGIRL
ncbi:MAG: PorT family protein [Sphingobacteriia bacterium]|nr:MAG: PorT family protein [Sphingobacteriia bacterium]